MSSALALLLDRKLESEWLLYHRRSAQYVRCRTSRAERRLFRRLELRLQAGYDHSYFFISTFIEDHLRFHARNLGVSTN